MQAQRFAMEYQEIPKESSKRLSLWRRSQASPAMVQQCLEPYRSKATEGGHGVGTGKYIFELVSFDSS